jgi:hypothetical protein
MSIKLRVIGANQTEVVVGEVTLFFSYSTLVAAHAPFLEGSKFARTEHVHSKTTQKHINAWLGNAKDNAHVLGQAQLESMFNVGGAN